MYGENEADQALMAHKIAAVVGFGIQGMAQSLNMRDSGLEVIVGEELGSEAWARAEGEGFSVMPIQSVAGRADIHDLQIPDTAFRPANAYNRTTRSEHKVGDDHLPSQHRQRVQSGTRWV